MQASLERTGRLNWVHWAVVMGSFAVTLFAWHASSGALAERTALRFERESGRVVELFTEQLQRHADILQATASLLAARDEDIGHEEWKRYHRSLDLPTLFPALSGLNVVHYVRRDEVDAFLADRRDEYPDYALHPAHERAFHLPVVHSATTVHAASLGFDMAHDEVRSDGVRRAVSSGRAQITAPVHLTYSDTRGFLMFVPFYRGDENDWKRADADGMAGTVLAIVRAESLAAGVLDRDKRLVWVRISDGGETLYDEHDRTHAGADAAPLFSRTQTVEVFGRDWRFDMESTAAFRRDAASIEPTLILVGGLLIDLTLMGMFVLLSRANRRALTFADLVAAKLRRRTSALEESNRTLESFACVASHDLKVPLNGIGYLADMIEEDLETLGTDEDALPEIGRNVGRIRRHVRRSRAMIDGILDYSGLEHAGMRAVPVDTRALVEGIGESLHAGAGRLALEGEFPTLVTDGTRLSQVFANLIGNAFKYHHDAARARVVVRGEGVGDFHRFSVRDDGPGIEPAHHERIFELFQTLGTREAGDSTGVGLSIVKKTVEAMGGSVRVESLPGRGTTFEFDWPSRIEGTDEEPGDGEASGADERCGPDVPRAGLRDPGSPGTGVMLGTT